MNSINYWLIACLLVTAGSADGKDESPVAAPTQPAESGFSGKVVETMSTAGYTYVLVDTGEKKLWAAAPQFNVKVGDAVTVADGMPMPNYHSKSLNRDFDMVYFSGGVTVKDANPGPGSAAAKLPPNHPPLSSAAAKPKVEQVDLAGINRAEGGLTVEEIYAKKSKLAGQPVKVRGKVVKYNDQIMGKNWLHLRDGTGDGNANDLTITTTDSTQVGDTILVTGTLALEKDFGYGYKYDLLLENARITVEQKANP